jgi:quercetin dioxygenase-like cupin family protein
MDDPVLGRFELAAEIGRYPPGEGASGRRAETLVKSDRLRVVLVTMRAGTALAEHAAPGPITIHALRGRFAVRADDEDHELAADGLLALAAGTRHAVRAHADGAFLLTIAWPSADA